MSDKNEYTSIRVTPETARKVRVLAGLKKGTANNVVEAAVSDILLTEYGINGDTFNGKG